MGKFESTVEAAQVLVITSEGGTVTVPDAHLMFAGEYSRSGPDLVITGDAGNAVIIADYFGVAGMPTLASPSGAVLLPDTVSAMAGPQAPGQYAQADDAEPQEGIGRVVTLTGTATAQRADGTVVELALDSRVAQGDVVQTGGGSALGIVFDDGALFNLNADSRMVLNEHVYEPGGSGNTMLFSLVQGVFSFVAGQIAPTGEMRIDTPAASMGIRGTSGIIKIGTVDGIAVFRLVPDPGTGALGSIVLFNPVTNETLVLIDSPDVQWEIGADGQLVAVPADPADDDIIQELHETFLEFAGVPTDTEDTQLAGGSGRSGSGLQSDHVLTDAELATIISLAGGALGETEPLSSDPPADSITVSEPPPEPVLLPEPPPPAPTENEPAPPVNEQPVAANDQLGDAETPLVDENTVAVIPVADLLANDIDGDGDVLTVTGVSALSALGAAVTLNPDGTISYDPRNALDNLSTGEVVIDSFTYTISDGRGGTSEATVSFSVSGISDAAAVDDGVETAEDSPAIFNVLDNDSGAGFSVVSVGAFSNPDLGTLQFLPDGTFTFNPALHASGTTSFTYQATNGTDLIEATVTVVVEPVADAPMLATGQGVAIPGGEFGDWPSTGDVTIVESHEGQLPTDGTVLLRLGTSGASDADIEALLGLAAGTLDGAVDGDVTEGSAALAELQVTAGDIVTFDWNFGEKDLRPFLDYGFVTIDGQLIKLAEVNDNSSATEWTGWHTFTFVAPSTGTLTLGFGVVDVGDLSLDSELLISNLRVASGQVTGEANSAIALDIAASLADLDGSETLSILVAGVPEGAVLSAGTDNGDGTWSLSPAQLAGLTITPPPDSTADFTLTVTATASEDGNGDTATNTRTLDVLVNVGNQGPVAADDAVSTDENAAVNGNVLTNDSDPDEDPLTVGQVNGSAANIGTQIALASGALLLLNADGSFAYDPNGQFDALQFGDTAQDSFTYTVSDGQGGSDTATVTLTIHGVNDAPIGVDSLIATNEGVAASGTLAGSDENPGDAISFSLDQAPTQGTVVIDADGSFTYTPNAETTGPDSFSYRVTDQHGDFSTATVTIDIAPLGDGEVPKDITGTAGNDVLIGSSLDDSLLGGQGNDTIDGGAGQDFLRGGGGDDLLISGGATAGFDAVNNTYSFFQQDRLEGAPGNDTLIATGGDVLMFGGPGDDIIMSQDDGSNWVDFTRVAYRNSPAGIVVAMDGSSLTVQDGWNGTDTVSRVHVLVDSPHDDVITVDSNYQTSFGTFFEARLSAGNDTVTFVGFAGRISYQSADGPVLVDLELGTATDLNPGDSFIGSDSFFGTVGVLRGSGFNDELLGTSGNDRLRGEGGNDLIDGRAGNDTIQFAGSDSGVHVDLSQGMVLNDGLGGGVDTLVSIENVDGSAFADLIIGDGNANRLTGGIGDDTLRGGAGSDVLIGDSGNEQTAPGTTSNDSLHGGGGNDNLFGGDGDDLLNGGLGNDQLTGGDGIDRFAYDFASEGFDSIIDFTLGEDLLVIDVAGFGGGLDAGNGLTANQFVSGPGAQPTQAQGQFLYDTSSGDLFWDQDGTGETSAVAIANLAGAPALTTADFELIDSGGAFLGMAEVAAAVEGGSEPVA